MGRIETPILSIVGDRPIMAAETEDGGLDIAGYDWNTGAFVRDAHSYGVFLDGGIDARRVNQEEFWNQVERNRSRSTGNRPCFDRLEDRTRESLPRREESSPGLLSREATEQKCWLEYDGDASRLLGVNFGRLVFENMDLLFAAPEKLRAQVEILSVVDRFQESPPDGDGFLLVGYRLSQLPADQIPAVLTLSLRSMVEAYEANKHLYEEMAELNRRRLAEDRPFTPEERGHWENRISLLRVAYMLARETMG